MKPASLIQAPAYEAANDSCWVRTYVSDTSMIWLRSNGRMLEARRAGEAQICLRAKPNGPPLPLMDNIYDDEDAVARLRELSATGLYERVE
jgi:hypothetical protein